VLPAAFLSIRYGFLNLFGTKILAQKLIVDEIDTWSQFHQHFICVFFIQKQIEQIFYDDVWLCNFFAPKHWQKNARVMLMKLTPERHGVPATSRPSDDHSECLKFLV